MRLVVYLSPTTVMESHRKAVVIMGEGILTAFGLILAAKGLDLHNPVVVVVGVLLFVVGAWLLKTLGGE